MKRLDLATIAVVLLLLVAPAIGAVTGPSHTATAGVSYVTNSGLDVQLGDDREVEAVPFADDQTFASDGLEIEAGGSASVTVTDQAFSGPTMAVNGIDASTNAVTFRRDTLTNDYTVSGGVTDIIAHNATIDDGAVDVEVVADSPGNITVSGLADVDNFKAVDSDGDTIGTGDAESGTFDVPAGSYQLRLQDAADELLIRDLVTQELVTENASGAPLNVTVEFFGDDGAVEQRTTSDGSVSMAGLPQDQRFAVTVDAGGDYVQREIIIPSLIDQQTAWLLPDTADIPTVEPRFFLEDPSNQFDTEESEIILSRPLEINGTTEFVAVAGDRVGLNGFDPLLERDQRYRVTVRNPATGAERVLGEFTPTAAETVTLTVQDVEFDSVAEVQGLDWTARYLSNEDSADEVEFIFRDAFPTQSLSYEIVARDDNSTVLASGTATGNVTVREPVPPGESDTIWVVSWETTRTNGETLSASRQVSSSRLPGAPELGDRWQTAIAMISLFVVAGLFGAASPGVGGIAVASVGGVFFFIGWLPDSTGGLMVVLALFIAVLAFVGRKARGATA